MRDLATLVQQFVMSHDMKVRSLLTARQLLVSHMALTAEKDSPILSADSMRLMSQIAFRDWDGKTAMSYPRESFFIDSYFVRCKAGNQNGYAPLCIATNSTRFARLSTRTQRDVCFEISIC